MELPEAYYLPVAGTDEVESTVATASPWDLTQQHGGPPSALLVRAIERRAGDPALRISRLTVDMLGPIAQGRIRTETEVVRPGRRVELVEARLFADDALAVRATAWRIREDPDSTRHLVDPPAPLPERPATGATTYFEGIPPEWGYGPSIEWRFVEGDFTGTGSGRGRARLWTRVRLPLVAGEEITALQRLLVVADSANGVSMRLPITEWWSIPPTLSVTIARESASEWLWFDVTTHIGPHGRGVAHATLSDTDGPLAWVEQPLLVSRR